MPSFKYFGVLCGVLNRETSLHGKFPIQAEWHNGRVWLILNHTSPAWFAPSILRRLVQHGARLEQWREQGQDSRFDVVLRKNQRVVNGSVLNFGINGSAKNICPAQAKFRATKHQ